MTLLQEDVDHLLPETGEKKEEGKRPKSLLWWGAGLEGFEPPTRGPGNRCSIP